MPDDTKPAWWQVHEERRLRLLRLLAQIADVEKAAPCATPECAGRPQAIRFTPSISADDLWTASNDCSCGVMGEFLALDEEAVALLLDEGWKMLRIIHDHVERVGQSHPTGNVTNTPDQSRPLGPDET